MNFQIAFVLLSLLFLVIVLYLNKLRPAIAYILIILSYFLLGIISPEEFLKGLANKQIIIIFLLIALTAGIRELFGSRFFYSMFRQTLSPNAFRWKLTGIVGGLSALLNNTPIVAFMIPYVKEWADKKGVSASRFLIPLSFATILGGTITVIGTSTNLVLNGLITSYDLPALGFQDFFFLGLCVAIPGIVYLNAFGDRLLPDRGNELDKIKGKLNEYIIETTLKETSPLVGKTVQEAGLRQLRKMFLVEILRSGKAIAPVSPHTVLEANDLLYFSGETAAIFEMIKESNGIVVSEQVHVEQNAHFQFTEAVIPSNSLLVGHALKDSDFRNKFKASIIAIQRKGVQISKNLGEEILKAGDLLLLLKSKDAENGHYKRDLILISPERSISEQMISPLGKLSGLAVLALLILGIVGVMDLFMAVFIGLAILIFTRFLGLEQVRNAIDPELLIVLVSALAVGVALLNSGAAQFLADGLSALLGEAAVLTTIAVLFLVTLLLTTLITNAAAVSMMFPIALATAENMQLPSTPFFVAIAFAASGDFMTPIGYQTNLMVLGPGNYKFKDFFKVGFPLTLAYSAICIVFIVYFYKLV